MKVTHFQLSKVGLNVDLYLSKYETLQLSEEDCFHVETQFSSAARNVSHLNARTTISDAFHGELFPVLVKF